MGNEGAVMEAIKLFGELGNQTIVYPRQLRGNFLVPHSSLGKRGSSSSIRGGGTLGGEQEGDAVCYIFTFTFDQGK